jgi:hypothetical protein
VVWLAFMTSPVWFVAARVPRSQVGATGRRQSLTIFEKFSDVFPEPYQCRSRVAPLRGAVGLPEYGV